MLSELRAFEAMFVDNKEYVCAVRGGAKQTLVFVDYKTRAKMKLDVGSKKHNGQAFRKMLIRFGVHELPYKCLVYTDGCGSMAHVASAAADMGVDHANIPPHQQSLSEAEKVCDRSFESARACIVHSKAPDFALFLCVDYVIYVDMRTATTKNCDWMTSYERCRGVVPAVTKLHRFWTRCFVTVPKSKRKKLAKQGLHFHRAEPGRFVGFQSLFSSN